MLFRKRNSPDPCFQLAVGPSIVLGTGACVLFYGSILVGPLDFTLLRRYCLGHPAAIAAWELFFVAIVLLGSKWIASTAQQRVSLEAGLALDDIALAQPDTPVIVSGEQRAQWFETLWRTQASALGDSWLGQRVTAVLQRQIKRNTTKHLDQDIHELADRDAGQQRDNYGLIRVIIWSIPAIGFLGALMGISDILYQMDARVSATGPQDATQNITSGLHVAFDTAAIGIVLTMVAVFVRFGVNRTELFLLRIIDTKVSDAMHLCLTEQVKLTDTSNVEASLQRVTQELLFSVQQSVQSQSELWRETISDAHSHWQSLTSNSAETLQACMAGAIESALAKHQESLSHHTEQLSRVQSEGAVLIDSRWQQWQTTLSEQARAMHQQQRDMTAQTQLLNLLIEKHDAVRSMERPLQATLERLTDVDRFHDAAICLTEAVAVLGTQMERYGYLGRQPLRRKSKEAAATQKSDENAENETPEILPLKRRAG